MDVIIGAGGVAKEGDPLLGLVAEGEPKALLNIAGKPMVQYVLDAVANSDKVQDVIVVGLSAEHGIHCGDKQVHYLSSAGSLFDNASAASQFLSQINPEAVNVLWVSADIPLVNTDMIDWMIDEVEQTEHDLYYSIIARETMEKRFPDSKRSFTRLKSGQVCGGDVNAYSVSLTSGSNTSWQQIVEARKSMLRVASMVGLLPLLMLATGRMTKARTEQLVLDKLGVRGRLIDCPYAELGMDIDKPYQYDIVARELGQTVTIKN